ncbi:MAG: SpoIIE family protein phosphatase [Bacteroidota bacterium]
MIKSLINKGVKPGITFHEQKKIRLTNSFSLVGIAIVSFFLFGSIFFPMDKEMQAGDVLTQSINFFVFLLIYFLSAKGKNYASRILLVIWLPLFLSVIALMCGIQMTASYISIVPTALMVLFLFDRKAEIISLFLYCFLVFITVIMNEKFAFVPKIPIAIENFSWVYVFECCMAFMFIYVIGNNFKSEHATYQKMILHSNQELESQKQDIISSINYAKRIQTAILPHEETISRSLPLYFILYRPKDIVSGDFYWFHEIDKDSCIFVCADCTGHGVPGAFMTVIASNLLNQTVIDNKIYKPSDILYEVDKLLNVTLKQDKERLGVQDGMDLTLIKINKNKKELTITSAKRPVFFIANNELQEFKGSKTSIGGMREGEKKFEEFTISYKEDDMLYLFTDGYHDQFGGEKGKKYSTKRLKEKLFSIHKDTIYEQKDKLEREIMNWKGDLEQVDDICIAGIRF